MKVKAMKRTFLRTHRYGMVRQLDEKRTRGAERNVRSPQGRELLASNMVYRKRQSHYFEFGSRRNVNAGTDGPAQWFDHCKVCDGRETAPQHLR
ncbi:hypothetical protein [Streptomyces sp. NPDC060001]|uniref:hypothetical protein n=1 Tax=Streptomyces sp. NPDC060001 TaxID=3347032 RepID=UPI0036C1E6B8